MRFLIAGIAIGWWAGRHSATWRERNLEARLALAETERDEYLDAWNRDAEQLRDRIEFEQIITNMGEHPA